MLEFISIDNMFFCGCNLCNIEWVFGIVVFIGYDIKIMMNVGIMFSKWVCIVCELNFNVICNLGIFVVICLVVVFVNGVIWVKDDVLFVWFEYGFIGLMLELMGFIIFWVVVIVFQNLILIFLYILFEIVWMLQVYFIYSDMGMYYDKIDQFCIFKFWNIFDDVG